MPLTAAQLATLKADIAANPNEVMWLGAATAINALPDHPDAYVVIAAWYNQKAAPSFWAWRTRVSKDEYANGAGPDGTTFSWTGAGFISRSQGERDAWREMFSAGGPGGSVVNPSLANVRQAFADIFSGNTAPAPANRTHLTAVSRGEATNQVKLFSSGTGSAASPATPAANVTEFTPLTPQDVEKARLLP